MISGSMSQSAKHASPQFQQLPATTPAVVSRWDSRDQVSARRPLQIGRLQRVAALLSSISRNNSYEGRDPDIIPDSLASGFVAELLGLRVSDVVSSLCELEHLGLIAQSQGGALRVLDRPALDRLIDAH
jgi:Crp-like helix-turn-helix domain